MNSCALVQLNIQISQGSATTDLRRGGIFSFENAVVKMVKTVLICQSYCKKGNLKMRDRKTGA